MLRLLWDTESNGFLANATRFHCIGITNVDTGEYKGYRPHELDAALEEMTKADVIIGQNIIRHDIPLAKKLKKGWSPKPGAAIKDTMVISRTMFPNIKATDIALVQAGKLPPKYKGKHSVAAWGHRLGNPKGDYAEIMEAKARELGLENPRDIANFVWGQFNEDMFEYMAQDCATNFDMWKHFNPDAYPQAPLDLEHRISRVCDAMNTAGVPFDLQAAGELQAELVGKKHVIETKLKEKYGFWFQPVSPDPTKSLFIPKQPNRKPAVATLDENGDWEWSNPGYWGDETITEEPKLDVDGNPVVNAKGIVQTRKVKTFVGYPCTKLKKIEFNPGSSDHLSKKLIEQGWRPTKFTDGGKPAMDEEVIESIGNLFPDMDGLPTLLMVNKRLSQLVGGKSSKYPLIDSVGEDGCIHGVINPMGTITSRAAHMFPNLGQVPSAKKPYGHEFRRLFTKHLPTPYHGVGLSACMLGKMVPWKFLGADQEGLELRGLAHYLHPLDGGKYCTTVISGDPHWLHAVVMGLAEGERDKANQLHTVLREDGSKRFIYAYIYGCGDEKAGSIIYEALLNARRSCGAEGAAIYSKFFTENPGEDELRRVGKKVRRSFRTRIEGFKVLQDKLSEQVGKRNRVIGLDGRIIPIRSDHSALNFLIQSAGAIVCKEWVASAFEELERRYTYNWDDPWAGDFVFVLWVHDEVQLCVREGLEEEIGKIIVDCARKAGVPYGLRVPLDSKYVVGDTWEDTH
jgi:DNA polymerase I-like protein with 3'-5' exonuclease and polymerase domains